MAGLILFEDTLQKQGQHELKHRWWEAHGVEVVRTRLNGKDKRAPVDFGDYYAPSSNVVVDTKKDISELAQCVSSGHARFRRELQRASHSGYRLIILTENNDGVHFISDLAKWENPHCLYCMHRFDLCDPMKHGKCIKHGTRNKPIGGLRLAKTVQTMQNKYRAYFLFCTPSESAFRVCDALGMAVEHGD